jgi:transcription elongation GreA/GreB family factor
VGSPEDLDTVPTAWLGCAADATLGVVTAAQTCAPRGNEPFGDQHPRGCGVFLSSSDFEALVGELESLRAAVRVDEHSAASTSLLPARERAEADAARLGEGASLIELASAPTRVATVNGGAGPGSVVKVADRAGRTSEYELTLRQDADHGRLKVTLSSPVGKALLGARSGDYVPVTLSNGRRRRLRVINVTQELPAPLDAAFDGGDSKA